MGFLDKFKDLFGGRKSSKPRPVFSRKKDQPATIVEEIDVSKPSTKASKPVKTTKERMEEVDELKKFIEVVKILREEAGLPPVEEAFKEPKESPPIVQPAPPQPVSQRPPERPPVQPPQTAHPQPPKETPPPAQVQRKRTPSKAEIEKIVKVAIKRLENHLLHLVEEQLSLAGVKSFKERAMARRKVREYIRSHLSEITAEFANLVISGKDPRSDDFLIPYAKKLFPSIPLALPTAPATAQPPSPSPQKPKEEPVAAKEPPKEAPKPKEEDLLSLLESGEEGKEKEKKTEEGTGEEEEEDLLKLLES